MINWLKNRLTPAKIDAPRWAELAEALEETWDNLFSVPFDQAANLRSIYTSDEQGQRRKLAEYGNRYEKYLSTEYLPIMLAMRKLEMLQKDTAVPLEMMLIRSLGSAAENPIKPLYALSGDTYGTKFYTLDELDQLGIKVAYDTVQLAVDGTWKVTTPATQKLGKSLPYLTSRVAVVVDVSDTTTAINTTQLIEDFKFIKPLHIVFNGIYYQMYLTSQVSIRTDYSLLMQKEIVQHVSRLPVDGLWKLDGSKKVKSSADYRFGCSKLIEADFFKTEKLGKFRKLGVLEQRKLDGSWKVGGLKVDGSWKLDGSKRIGAFVKLGRMYSRTRLDGSWWLGSTKKLDGSWKVGGTSRSVTAEANIRIRKVK